MSTEFSNVLDIIEKIGTDLAYPAKGLILKHDVTLADKGFQAKEREHGYKEWLYYTDKYSNYSELLSIRLKFNYSLTLKNIGKDSNSINVFLPAKAIARFGWLLDDMIRFFRDNDVYYKSETGDLVFDSNFDKTKFKFVVGNNVILFTPTIIFRKDVSYEGVNMYINSTSNRYEVTIDSIYELWSICTKTDFYTASLALINYVGRPRGTTKYLNKVDVSYGSRVDNTGTGSSNMPKHRSIGSSASESDDVIRELKSTIVDRPMNIKF